MSFLRAKLRAVDKQVSVDNRLTNFVHPPIYTGDLYVKNNELVGANLDVCGNLTVNRDLHATNFYASGNYYLNNYLLIPYGTIIQCAAVNVPNGWLLCNGALISRFAYSNLYGALGYTYGGHDNSFNIPDLQGRVIVGTGTGAGLSTRVLGNTGGEERHALTTSEIPAHSHSLSRRSNPDDGAYDTDNGRATESSACTTDRAIISNFNTANTGGSNSHNNMQPFFVLNYLIKY